ncbi:MAG TPA: amidohydrolase [Gammaproteobacteria bacterium]|nr:amidohydrolase [Gammaproteobacteria bacterium]
MSDVRVACIQINAGASVDDNLRRADLLIREAAAGGAIFICTPEYFSGFERAGDKALPAHFPWASHPVVAHFSALAQALQCELLLGSVGVTSPDGRMRNRSVLLGRDGQCRAYYDKLHLFDVDLGGGNLIQESATIEPGEQAVVAEADAMRLGMSVCYDLRFPRLYRQLAQAGAQVLTVPAAFTRRTGEAHWHILLRSRAIENSCFVLAAAQCGKVTGGGENYGHSLIVSPWGDILAEAGTEEGVIVADLDLSLVERCRQRIPVLVHERSFSGPE